MPSETHAPRCTYHRGITGSKIVPDSPEVRRTKREAWVAAGGQKMPGEPRRLRVYQDEISGNQCNHRGSRCEWIEHGKCGWFGDRLERRVGKSGRPSEHYYLRTEECMNEKAPRKGTEA